jgi:hypothetical protein
VIATALENVVRALVGDTATGRCYLDLRASQTGRSMIGSGHYEDSYVRTKDGGRFCSRKLCMRFFSPHLDGWAAERGPQ